MSDSTDTPAATRSAVDIRAAAKAAAAPGRGVILIPEWGGSIYIRAVSGDERAAFDRETNRRKRKEPDRVRARERLVILTATDEAGTPIFTAADEDLLASMDVRPVDKAFKMAGKLNGYFGDEDDDSGN